MDGYLLFLGWVRATTLTHIRLMRELVNPTLRAKHSRSPAAHPLYAKFPTIIRCTSCCQYGSSLHSVHMQLGYPAWHFCVRATQTTCHWYSFSCWILHSKTFTGGGSNERLGACLGRSWKHERLGSHYQTRLFLAQRSFYRLARSEVLPSACRPYWWTSANRTGIVPYQLNYTYNTLGRCLAVAGNCRLFLSADIPQFLYEPSTGILSISYISWCVDGEQWLGMLFEPAMGAWGQDRAVLYFTEVSSFSKVHGQCTR